MDNLPSLSRLLRFVNERENLRIRKASGHPGPWTVDPILVKYRFCNIRRRDDRVSQWLLTHYYPHMTGPDVWLAAAIARLINWPPTLAELLLVYVKPDDVDVFDPAVFAHVLAERKAIGRKVYTGAYMIYPGKPDEVLKNKEEFLAHAVLEGVIVNSRRIRQAVLSNRIDLVVEALSASFGMQTFMAGQVAADLTYLPGQLDRARDLYTYAPRGPGSQRGLNRLHAYKLNHLWSQDAFNEALMHVNREIQQNLQIMDLTLHDCQSIFCEWDKYERTRLGEGKPRSIYKPETAY